MVEEMSVEVADEPNLLRAAYGLPPGEQLPEALVMDAATSVHP